MNKLGTLTACVAGDYRYSTRVDVYLDESTNEVVITRSENGAIGGMDSFQGAHPFEQVAERRLPMNARPALVITTIKSLFDDIIKTYGKPSKNWSWIRGGRYVNVGLNAKGYAETLALYTAPDVE